MSRVLSVIARAVAAAALIASAAGCSTRSATSAGDSLLPQRPGAHVVVSTAVVSGLGRILVDGNGHALYMFPPDAGSRVSCVGACAGTWPPLAIADRDKAIAGSDVNAEDLSTLADPNTGARIVTYAGYPLYRYAGDLAAGQANGQALFSDGGPWYVLDPNGQPVTTDPGDAS